MSSCNVTLLLLFFLGLLGMVAGECIGTARDCSFFFGDSSKCNAMEGCSWSSVAGCTDCCEGFSKSCGEITSATQCASQDGCQWGSSEGTSQCSSGDTTVQVWNKERQSAVTKKMKHLQIGDRVLTGKFRYQPIYAFGHFETTRRTEFWKLQAGQTEVEMTGDHLIFVHGKSHPVPVDTVKVGDFVLLGSSGESNFEKVEVRKITKVEKQGIYAPFTADGTILVGDGLLLASNYVNLQPDSDGIATVGGISVMSHQTISHYSLVPYRIACFAGLCDTSPSGNEEGMPYYVGAALQLADLWNQQNVLVQAVALLLLLVSSALVSPLDWLITLLTTHPRSENVALLVIVLVVCGAWVASHLVTVSIRGSVSTKHKGRKAF